MFHMFDSFASSLHPLLFAELDDMLTRVGQGPLPSGPRALGTSDTSGNVTDASQPRRRVRSRRMYKIHKIWGQRGYAAFS